MKILILGIGNLLLSDEGVGIHCIQTLQQHYRFPDNVTLLDGGTAGMELLSPIAEADQLIIIDAVKTGQPPGTVVRINNDELPIFFRTKLSPHQLSLSDLLAATYFTGERPDNVTLFGVVPLTLTWGMDLTPKIAAQLPQLVNLVITELAQCGISPVEISN